MTENSIYLHGHSYHHHQQQQQQQRQFQFYAIVIQLILGLMANSIVLCSMAISIRRRHRFDHHHQQVRRKRAPVPVVDIIITLLVVQSILRILFRPAIQLACFYGYCVIFNDFLCCLQGFIITFIHYVHLWTMMMFLQDRYIKHYKQPNDYLCKCTHMVLYLTMSCAMFLVAIHLCAPIYGLSSYGFLQGELTCAMDWTARHSCPFYVYSVLLVSGPASLPTIYWTMRITYRSFIRKCWTFKMSNFRKFCCFSRANPSSSTTTTTAATVSCGSPPLQQHKNNNNDKNHNNHHLNKVQVKQNIRQNQNPPSLRFSSLTPPSPLPSSSQQQPEVSKNDGSCSVQIRLSPSTSSVVSCDNSLLSSSGESCLASVGLELSSSKNGQGSTNTTASIRCETRGCVTVIPMKKLKVSKRSSGSDPNRNRSVRETAICHRNSHSNGNDDNINNNDNNNDNKNHHHRHRDRLQAADSNKLDKNGSGRADPLPRSHTKRMYSGGETTTATSYSNSFFSPSSQLCRSLVLNEHRELITVAICAWIYLIGYLLKLSSDAWQSCFLMPMPARNHSQPSNQAISMDAMSTIATATILMNNVTKQTTDQHYQENGDKFRATPSSAISYNNTNHSHSQSQSYFRWFLAAYLDEMATTVLIPLILLTLHQRLRVILGICSEYVCLFKSRLQECACFKMRTTHHYHHRHHIAASGMNRRSSEPTTTTTRRSGNGGNFCCRCCCPPYGTGDDDDGGGSGL